MASPGPPSHPNSSSTDLRPSSGGFAPRRERRHQIPGLRQTPYLKLYLLRCDDPETYKSSARRLLREWIKSQVPQSQRKVAANNQENHDAFEWMILHVVVPDGQEDFVWPSKGSASVLEKVKADFNTSSKPSVDRIAQVLSSARHSEQPRAPDPSSREEGNEPFQHDSTRAWGDLVAKLKMLILNSFDLRVRQYEEDVRQRTAQRKLPGWNFCTFFVLKEGLAKGFETVGLLEDALMGYDELSLELTSALRDRSVERDDAISLRDYTTELLEVAQSARRSSQEEASKPDQLLHITHILKRDTEAFRERILANDVSAFEFRSYVFARQMHILYRMASLSEHTESVGSQPQDTAHNPMFLAEICGRSAKFIASISRTMRQDLIQSFCAQIQRSDAQYLERRVVIENVVASWIFDCSQQILEKTGKLFGAPEVNASQAGRKEYKANNHMSLLAKAVSPEEQRLIISEVLSDAFPCEELYQASRGSNQEQDSRLFGSIFSPLLAARARISLLARIALSSAAKRSGWKVGWQMCLNSEQLEDVALGCSDQTEKQKQQKPLSHRVTPLVGVYSSSLQDGLSSETAFHSLYEVRSRFFRTLRTLKAVGPLGYVYEVISTCWSPKIHSSRFNRYCASSLVSGGSEIRGFC